MDSHFQRLLDELGARARAEIDQVSAAARTRADTVAAESAARIERRRAAVISECDEDAQRARNGAMAAARYEGRGALLASQHAFVDRVLDAARQATNQRLALCVNAERLVNRADELLSFAGNGSAELRCRTPIAEHIVAGLGADSARVVADDCAPWGLTLTADDGRLCIDDTVDAWLAAERAAIAIDVCGRIEEAS
jgi:hypothetical protein